MNGEIKYTIIPDEICQVIYELNTFSEEGVEIYKDTTCICYDIDFNNPTNFIKYINNVKKQFPTHKIAWFTSRKTVPFNANIFDYIKLEDGLYMNISENENTRFININTKIETIEKLRPEDLYYFEKYEELKRDN